MTAWLKHELHTIARADDLHVAPFRDDGRTYGTPTWIRPSPSTKLSTCVLTTARALVGPGRGTAEGPTLAAAGMTTDVTFASVNGSISDRIDDAYRAKYGGSQLLQARGEREQRPAGRKRRGEA